MALDNEVECLAETFKWIMRYFRNHNTFTTSLQKSSFLVFSKDVSNIFRKIVVHRANNTLLCLSKIFRVKGNPSSSLFNI